MNLATTDLLGYPGRTDADLRVRPIYTKAEEERFRYLFNERQEVNDLEAEIRTKQGDHRICIISASLESGNANQGYMQGIVHDITNLKKAGKGHAAN